MPKITEFIRLYGFLNFCRKPYIIIGEVIYLNFP